MKRLVLAEVTEYGTVFRTGTPVTFRYLRNTEKAPNFGNRFQQDIEPAGRYLIHNPNPGALARGWESGEVTLHSPLVLPLTTTEGEIYGSGSWKAALFRHYGKRGAALSRAIVKDGYDGVVTVALYRGRPVDTREIVDLTSFAMRRQPLRRDYHAEPRNDAAVAALRSARRRLIGRLGGYRVYVVNGGAVRLVDVDFGSGGNPSRYGYVPIGEVWVEGAPDRWDEVAIALHEVLEAELMRLRGASYDDAHECASSLERSFRYRWSDHWRETYDELFAEAEKALAARLDKAMGQKA